MSARMTSNDLTQLADAVERLSKMRRETGTDVGVFENPYIAVGSKGIQFRLVWVPWSKEDSSNYGEYVVEESSS